MESTKEGVEVKPLGVDDINDFLSKLKEYRQNELYYGRLRGPGETSLGPVSPTQANMNSMLGSYARGLADAYRDVLERLGQGEVISSIEKGLEESAYSSFEDWTKS